MTRFLVLSQAALLWVACGPAATIRLAPEQCPPDPLSGEPAPWEEADSVQLAEGSVLELQGCRSEGDGWVTFRYVGPTPVSPFHLVELSLYEGADWVLLHGRTGRRWVLGGEPSFSPDGAWFATAALDLEAGYLRNHLDVWALEGDSVRRSLALDGDVDWGATEVRWVSGTQLEYVRVAPAAAPTAGRWLDSTRAQIALRGQDWVPVAGAGSRD